MNQMELELGATQIEQYESKTYNPLEKAKENIGKE